MPEELQPGASFSEIVESEASDEQSTPTPEEATPAATEGGKTPESETLGVLQEKKEEAPEEDGKPDLSIDPDLEKHPVLKAKWEAYVAQKEKGIDKFITEHTEKLKAAESFKDEYQPLVDFYQQFNDADTVDEAFGKMCAALEKTYGRPFGAPAKPTDGEAAPQTDGPSRYGFEFASEDKILETTLKMVDGLLEKRLGPIAKKFETDEQTATLKSEATKAIPSLKTTFEVSADPWVTPEKVEAAMREFPSLAPDRAFRAMYADEIARYAVKHAGKQTVRNMPLGEGGGTTRSDLKAGATFAEIVASEATLS